MFARVSFASLLVIPVVLSFFTQSIFAAPAGETLSRRQIGNLQCNINRLQIVRALGQTRNDVTAIASAGANDPDVTSATTDAISGLDNARDGIATIAQALITGQNAPPEGRDQVAQGLQAIQSALDSITSTDPNVTSAVSKAQNDLNTAVTAGEGVVSNCK